MFDVWRYHFVIQVHRYFGGERHLFFFLLYATKVINANVFKFIRFIFVMERLGVPQGTGFFNFLITPK